LLSINFIFARVLSVAAKRTGKKAGARAKADPRLRRIGDVFYETRVLAGREYTLRRFARERLGASVDPVMLGYIENGKRFPSEPLVRRLAALRREEPDVLLALLWRDRMVYAVARELRRVLSAPRELGGVEDAELAVLVSQALTALPDDGSWITRRQWKTRAARGGSRRQAGAAEPTAERLRRAENLLCERGLAEARAGKVRRRGRHYVARDDEERWALAMELAALFATGLLDKLAPAGRDTGTYLRNHYLHIRPDDLPEFQKRLDAALRALAEEFAADPAKDTRFLNVLVTSTPLDRGAS